jgi:hypothetical protein
MKHEYHEGPQAAQKFEKAMRAVFQAPKTVTSKQPARKPTRRKKTGSDKG